MEASALALNEENETLLADVEQLRKQAANDEVKYKNMESRCRTELVEAQEHLAISVNEMEKLEKEVETSHAKVAEHQAEKESLIKVMAEMQTLKEENTQKQETIVKFEAQMMNMCDQIATLESGDIPSQPNIDTSSNVPTNTRSLCACFSPIRERIPVISTKLESKISPCNTRRTRINANIGRTNNYLTSVSPAANTKMHRKR